ncbi:MAG: hypothetical protein HY064_17105 [Bacteroidetes bacterium]|nr:hypothetical protein [Bacteroidota bacterium]
MRKLLLIFSILFFTNTHAQSCSAGCTRNPHFLPARPYGTEYYFHPRIGSLFAFSDFQFHSYQFNAIFFLPMNIRPYQYSIPTANVFCRMENYSGNHLPFTFSIHAGIYREEKY